MADDTVLPLSASNVIGIVQRAIRELDHYLGQPWYRIDKNRALAYLGECAQWINELQPLPEQNQQQPAQPPLLPEAQSQKRRS